MKNEIKVLNQLAKDQKKYFDKLDEFYTSKKILLTDVTDYKESGLLINAEALNQVAVKIDKPDNKDVANKLYKTAIECGSSWAKRNYAFNLLNKIDPTAENLETAITLLKDAAAKKKEIDVNYLLGKAHYQLKQYATAYYYFKKVPQKTNNKDNPEHTQADKYLAKYEKLPRTMLEQLFDVVGEDVEPPVENLQLEDNLEREKPWYSLTRDIDGFDPHDEVTILLNYRKEKIESEMADAEVTAVTKQLKEAKSEKEPPTVLEALQLKKIEAKKQQLEKSKQLSTAEAAYNDLLETTRKREYRRQVQTEKHFLSPHRTHSPLTKDIAIKLQQNRLTTEQASVVPIEGTNVPGRRFLTADLSTLQTLLHSYGRMPDYQQMPGWHVDPSKTKKGQGYYNSYEQNYGNTETIILGAGQLQYYHRVNPHSNHIGDFYMKNFGTYSKVYLDLARLAGSATDDVNRDGEIQIAKWMLRYSSSGIVVKLQELQRIYVEATKDDIEKLMQIFFHCLIKEPMSWMMAANESHELPYATAQARAIKLISTGYLSLKDVFDSDAPFGIFTGGDIGKNITAVREKIDRINDTYESCVLMRKETNYQPYYQFKREHPKGKLVTSRSHLHQELLEMYGGGEDTDGEGYDSDTAESQYKTVFEFN